MIASTSPFEFGEFTGTTIYVIATPRYAFSDFTLWIPLAPKNERRTSRHVPFYRGLFNQEFVAPAQIISAHPKLRQWMPNMGRVRVNRT